MDIGIAETAKELTAAQDVLIIAHKSPDGDTLGSSFALLYALLALGKRARVECSDAFPQKYAYFLMDYKPQVFIPRYIVAVDVADTQLFGERTKGWAGRVNLCIDHHKTNVDYAALRCLDPAMAATAQLMYRILMRMEAPITPLIADCLFTGLTTDTGCFRYSSTTADTHRAVAELMERGAQAGDINRIMFEQKTKGRIAVERLVMDSLEYEFDGRCAMICISKDILKQSGALEDELEGVSSMPRQIEGVWAGVTFNEREDGYKISVRTSARIDASLLCAKLGGGGHSRAAGCFVRGNLAEARAAVRAALIPFIRAAEELDERETAKE